jgi:hypothetical protein
MHKIGSGRDARTVPSRGVRAILAVRGFLPLHCL